MNRILATLFCVIAVSACSPRGSSQGTEQFAYRDLRLVYPKSFELVSLPDNLDTTVISFSLAARGGGKSGIDFGISEFEEDFLSTVPSQELMGELVATVFDMKGRLFSMPGVIVENFGEPVLSNPGERPEVYAFAVAKVNGKTVYYTISSLIAGHYNVNSVSYASDPQDMQALNEIIDNILYINPN